MSTPPNAFQTVRPRGPDLVVPATAPRNSGSTGKPQPVRALDRNGKRTVSIAPRVLGLNQISIEPAAAAKAAADKRFGMRWAGI